MSLFANGPFLVHTERVGLLVGLQLLQGPEALHADSAVVEQWGQFISHSVGLLFGRVRAC